jgi:hypothetical protein
MGDTIIRSTPSYVYHAMETSSRTLHLNLSSSTHHSSTVTRKLSWGYVHFINRCNMLAVVADEQYVHGVKVETHITTFDWPASVKQLWQENKTYIQFFLSRCNARARFLYNIIKIVLLNF